jgi:hypothetical protein
VRRDGCSQNEHKCDDVIRSTGARKQHFSPLAKAHKSGHRWPIMRAAAAAIKQSPPRLSPGPPARSGEWPRANADADSACAAGTDSVRADTRPGAFPLRGGTQMAPVRSLTGATVHLPRQGDATNHAHRPETE